MGHPMLPISIFACLLACCSPERPELEYVTRNNQGPAEARILRVGNTLYSYRYRGKEIFYFPAKKQEYKRIKNLHGNPFLYPFANRLENAAITFQDRTYKLPENFPYFKDGKGLVLHGTFFKEENWEIIESRPERHRAKFKVSNGTEQYTRFPFQHEIHMQHDFRPDGVTIRVEVTNRDKKDMPVSFGFHPYFTLENMDRKRTKIRFPAKSYFVLNEKLLPTGEIKAVKRKWSDFPEFELKDKFFDHVFTDLERDKDGFAVFKIERPDGLDIEIKMDRGYQTAVLFTPLTRPFICIEPMVAPTNGINLNHEKKWKGLPVIKPGKTFRASFQIKVSERN